MRRRSTLFWLVAIGEALVWGFAFGFVKPAWAAAAVVTAAIMAGAYLMAKSEGQKVVTVPDRNDEQT